MILETLDIIARVYNDICSLIVTYYLAKFILIKLMKWWDTNV